MNTDIDTCVQEIRSLVQSFCEREIVPSLDEDEANGRFRVEVMRGLGALGITGIVVPAAYEGCGLGFLHYAASIEELAYVNAGYALSFSVSCLPATALRLFGSEAQKRRYLPGFARGESIGAFSMSEADAGSDVASLGTRAELCGSHYVVNGTKLWCTNGNVADVFVIMVRTGGPGAKGVSALIVDKDTPGLSCGPVEKKMGCHTSPTVELRFDNIRVPAANLLGKEGDGFKIAMTVLQGGRIGIGALAVGVARAALDQAVRHSCERRQFGKAIHEFQGVSFPLADMATQIAAAHGLVERAARLADAERPFGAEASMAKLFATDMAMQVTTDALQILGAIGYSRHCPMERFMRDVKIMQILEGTNQIQRVIISRALIAEREAGAARGQTTANLRVAR